ncbi:hypothetical protein V5O48_006857 [Marasmius crinis-equi]|uniref:CxC2-like cysteine cluster KDZ transposase-associated domain-containing protein n=1 Tax=Marasmius crinis-equi TaxID=585013 RepID=A0ABR3FIS4_9AGAR
MPRAAKSSKPTVVTTRGSNTKAHNVYHATQNRVQGFQVPITSTSNIPSAPVESLLKVPSVEAADGEELGGITVKQRKRYIDSEWKKDHFRTTSLRALGVRYQLGHKPGERCSFPKPGYQEFVVLAWNGIHIVNIDFCSCSEAIDHHFQLLEAGWWPMSYKDPRSAVSIELLRNFHITNLQCQAPPTDFYRSLMQMTDGTGLEKLPDREAQWMDVLRQYRHIKMMQRCGRGHDPEGISKTALGSATVVCRACPFPTRNLPDGWQDVARDDRFLYALYLSEDANFKQKARARPNDSRDPALGPGFGCFVPPDVYMEEISKHKDQKEISRCQSFKALDKANLKRKGLRATGIGSVSCARHETFRPNGMGDLQKGERYCNMDFLALFTLIGCPLLLVFFSYDIACQWMVNFFFRMATFPEYMRLPNDMEMIFKVPKWHLTNHVVACLAAFSFGFTEGAGRTDGEAPERCWAWLNSIARSASMMTAGARWDTMDDFANAWNYKKMLALETSLVKKMITAIPQAVINVRVFHVFTEALKIDHASDLNAWLEQVVDWEQGSAVFCPYEVREPAISLAKIKKKLAEEEQHRAEKGERAVMSSLIMEGVDLEDVQRTLVASLGKRNPTILQQKALQEKRTGLLRRIQKHRKAMVVHMPLLQNLIDKLPEKEASSPETMQLFLPSSLPAQNRHQICPQELITVEDELRWGQCFDSLARLRSQLQARTVAYKDTERMTPTQGLWTRMDTLRNQIETKIKALTATYRMSRKALFAIRGDGPWTNILKVLNDNDVRGITERVLKDKEKEDWEWAQRVAGVREDAIQEVLDNRSVPTADFNPLHSLGQSNLHLSWIWYTHQPSEDGVNTFEEVKDSLRSEWCKARANSRRPREELRLVEEEMRRAIQYCHFQAGWWTAQIGRRGDVSPWLGEGLIAYAREHSEIEVCQAMRWGTRWAPVRARAKEILDYVSDPGLSGDIPSLKSLEIELDLDDDGYEHDELAIDTYDDEF